MIDITGKKFNKLTAIRFDHRRNDKYYWVFRCDCGNEKVIIKSSVVGGYTKSCGCATADRNIDITGKKFNYLTAIRLHHKVGNENYWLFRCDCGGTRIALKARVVKGEIRRCKSPNCIKIYKPRSVVDISGKRFGNLVALHFHHIGDYGAHFWEVQCDCGKIVIKIKSNLTAGNVKSCGCRRLNRIKTLTILNTTHGLSNSRFYRIFTGMKERCNNPKRREFPRYGGRGIKVCRRWMTFKHFKTDMYELYLQHVEKFGIQDTEIDRIDNDRGYSLENCRWATKKEQMNNRGCSSVNKK